RWCFIIINYCGDHTTEAGASEIYNKRKERTWSYKFYEGTTRGDRPEVQN
ncbi:unnamed protein product, partial [Urochloa humidicola]